MQQNKQITRFSINSQQNNKHSYKITYRCSLPLPDITKTVLKVDLTVVCFIASKRRSAHIRRVPILGVFPLCVISEVKQSFKEERNVSVVVVIDVG